MLQWLRLTICLLLSAAVSGEEVQCGNVFGNYRCWNSATHDYVSCLGCTIIGHQTTINELSIAPKHRNGSAADVELVKFFGGVVTKMPKVINKGNNKQILRVELQGTKTRVLNAQFFGNSAQNLIHFESFKNDNLSVAASAFQNFAALEVLNLYDNGNSFIAPEAFRGLNKLVRLNLEKNKLTAINENWFDDLGNLEVLYLSGNQLTEIADTAFQNLHKLKELYLYENKIEIVTRKMFQHNQQLEQIHLWSNQIKVIQSESFAHLLKLSRLDLKGNECIDRNFRNSNPEEISAALTACRPTICVIPLIPNGYIVSIEDNSPQTVGNSAGEYNPVKVVCNKSYSLFHDKETQTENSCLEDNWTNEKWPECHRK